MYEIDDPIHIFTVANKRGKIGAFNQWFGTKTAEKISDFIKFNLSLNDNLEESKTFKNSRNLSFH